MTMLILSDVGRILSIAHTHTHTFPTRATTLRTYFTGVESRGIGAVAFPSFKGVEVERRARLRRVPRVVDILLSYGEAEHKHKLQ